jgi:hypothetical protein
MIMTIQKTCIDCGGALTKDEVALSQKMLGRKIVSFYCIKCLAVMLDCDPDDLVVKIQEFKEQGCALFL